VFVYDLKNSFYNNKPFFTLMKSYQDYLFPKSFF